MIPVRPRPLPDELLSSWIIRASFANGTDPIGLAGSIWGEWRAWTVDFDRHLAPERLAAFARATGFDTETVLSMTLEPEIRSVNDGELPPILKAWRHVVPIGARNRTRTNGLHYCPRCLAESPVFFRKKWRFSWHTVCDGHGTMLEYGCPACGMPFSPHLADYLSRDTGRCPRCGADLRGDGRNVSDPDVLPLQRDMDATLKKGRGGDIELFRFAADCAVLARNAGRDRKLVGPVSETFGLPGVGYAANGRGYSTFDAAPVEQRHIYWGMAARMVRAGAETVAEILAENGTTRKKLDEYCPLESAAMREIRDLLPGSGRAERKTCTRKVEAGPKTPEEVERAMDAVRRFL